MEDRKTERYDCAVLGETALVQVTRRYAAAGEPSRPVLRSLEFTDCRDKLRCGIARHDGHLITYDWRACPACAELKL